MSKGNDLDLTTLFGTEKRTQPTPSANPERQAVKSERQNVAENNLYRELSLDGIVIDVSKNYTKTGKKMNFNMDADLHRALKKYLDITGQQISFFFNEAVLDLLKKRCGK
ncbi:MAG: hypothetical protein VZQ61_06990 [Christensenellaceae bacterium]